MMLAFGQLLTSAQPEWKGLEKMITQQHLDTWFTYHSPTPEKLPRYTAIRAAAKVLAETILENTPASADQSDAIRKVREAVMTANAAIACDGQ